MYISMVFTVYVAVSRNGKGMDPDKFQCVGMWKRHYLVEQTGTLDFLSCYTTLYVA